LFISGEAGQGGILVFKTYLDKSGIGGHVPGECSGQGAGPPQSSHLLVKPSILVVKLRSIMYANTNPKRKGTIIGFRFERRI
jgi:hypothetical protein